MEQTKTNNESRMMKMETEIMKQIAIIYENYGANPLGALTELRQKRAELYILGINYKQNFDREISFCTSNIDNLSHELQQREKWDRLLAIANGLNPDAYVDYHHAVMRHMNKEMPKDAVDKIWQYCFGDKLAKPLNDTGELIKAAFIAAFDLLERRLHEDGFISNTRKRTKQKQDLAYLIHYLIGKKIFRTIKYEKPQANKIALRKWFEKRFAISITEQFKQSKIIENKALRIMVDSLF